jgi:hypothetical protein
VAAIPPLLPRSLVRVRRARIPLPTQSRLWVHAGGRCEIRGCNEYLLTDGLTLSETNYANIAHIVAAKRGGPRGDDPMPLDRRNDIANLLLVCTKHHSLIDSPEHLNEWPKQRLLEHKKEHEERVLYLSGLHDDQKTFVVRLRSQIGDEPVEIPFEHIQKAVLPRYPADRDGLEIDLTQIRNTDSPEYWRVAADEITRKLSLLHEPGVGRAGRGRVSVFALAPIPLLVHLGYSLSNKIPADLYQRHRDTQDWCWKTPDGSVDYRIDVLNEGADPARVGVVLALSGTVSQTTLPASICENCWLFQMTTDGVLPNPTFLKSSVGLERFVISYHNLIGKVQRAVPSVSQIHLFPAVPAPIAVACGRELLAKAHPSLHVYDFDKEKGEFKFALNVN